MCKSVVQRFDLVLIMDSSSMVSAEKMLDEIRSESIQQLVASVIDTTQASLPTTVSALDSFLSICNEKHPHPRDSLFHSSTNNLQIRGRPGSGKTHFLYFILSTCIMPTEHLACRLDGWQKAAIVIDMDGQFSFSRFRALLSNRLRQHLPSSTIAAVVESCLELLHIFRPNSSEQLAITLAHLPEYCGKHFPNVGLGLVAVHSMDAFYWMDRFKAEQMRSTSASVKGGLHQKIYSVLQNIRLSYNATVLITYWGLPQSPQGIHRSTDNTSENTINHGSASRNTTPASWWPHTWHPSTVSLALSLLSTEANIRDEPRGTEIHVITQTSAAQATFRFHITQEGLVVERSELELNTLNLENATEC